MHTHEASIDSRESIRFYSRESFHHSSPTKTCTRSLPSASTWQQIVGCADEGLYGWSTLAYKDGFHRRRAHTQSVSAHLPPYISAMNGEVLRRFRISV